MLIRKLMNTKEVFVKSNLTSRLSLLALLMAALVFSDPFVVFAQQDSIEVQAKMDAERDANADVNRLLWAGAGCLSFLLGAAAGVVTGAAIIEGGNLLENTEIGVLAGAVVGASTGCLFSLGITSRHSAPPPQRLLGKSPEYVDSYTTVYKTKIKQRRRKSAVVGALAILPFGVIMNVVSAAAN